MGDIINPTPGEIQLSDPLKDITRKERRTLLAMATIGIIVVKTGLVPTKISALGIDFSMSDQLILFRAFAAIIGYFLVAFVLYAASDFIAWRLAWRQAFQRAAIARQKEEEEYDLQMLTPKSYQQKMARQGLSRDVMLQYASPMVSSLRAVFDFFVPIVIGIVAISMTLKARPSLPSSSTASAPTVAQPVSIHANTNSLPAVYSPSVKAKIPSMVPTILHEAAKRTNK